MSMPRLPSYYPSPSSSSSTTPPAQVPSYSAEPPEYERRIALAEGPRPRPPGSFSQTSRGGDVRLTLTAQEPGIETPVYGVQGCVEGVVEMQRPDTVISVEVKVEGRLKLREVAEDGSSSAKLCLNSQVLWPRGATTGTNTCPSSLSFAMNLPTTFNRENKNYPLPPTFDVKLSGLPGFSATIDYFISATIQRTPTAVSPLVNSVKSNILKMNPGVTVIRIPFNYIPRTRPAVSLPPRLRLGRSGFHCDTSDWSIHKSEITSKLGPGQGIQVKLYIPSSRVFSISQQIPFHLMLEGNPRALSAFVPFGPVSPQGSRMGAKSPMKIEVMRQSSVDSRNAFHAAARTDMWHTDMIGSGHFRHVGDTPTWVAFSGEINVAPSVRVSGFKAHGLTVKDCILFSMIPFDPQKCPFWELRQVIPIQLTTDSWISDGTGMGADQLPSYD